MSILHGLSSLLFLIPMTYCKNPWTKINIGLLTAASFCNNAFTSTHPTLVFIDHAMIYSTCMSFIKNKFINAPLYALGAYEIYMYGDIQTSKNMAYTIRSIYYFYRCSKISMIEVFIVYGATAVFILKTTNV